MLDKLKAWRRKNYPTEKEIRDEGFKYAHSKFQTNTETDAIIELIDEDRDKPDAFEFGVNEYINTRLKAMDVILNDKHRYEREQFSKLVERVDHAAKTFRVYL